MSHNFRTVIPKVLAVYVKKREKELWEQTSDADLGQRHPMIHKAVAMDPATSVTEGITGKLREILPGAAKKQAF